MNRTIEDAVVDDAAVKDKHRAVWASGDYPRVAETVIASLGAALVDAAGIGAGQRVLDVAAGNGNATVPAARAGASVVASDLTPSLVDAGRARTTELGLDVTWEVADAERLPYDDGSFDAAISSVGVMFAPRHQAAADELVRVVRPGGTIALANWTPGGFIGRLFATMKPFAPAPPPGAQPPPLWGDPDHVAFLLGDRVVDLRTPTAEVVVDAFESPEEWRDFFRDCYGPTIAVYRANAQDPRRIAALEAALADLAREHWEDGAMRWEYLLVTARRA